VDSRVIDYLRFGAPAQRTATVGVPGDRCHNDRVTAANEGRATADVHPDHDAVHLELRSWFTTSAPEIDYVVEEQWYGYLSGPSGSAGSRLILTIDDPDHAARALGDARHRAGGPVTVWVDDKARWRRLDRSLRDAGCRSVKSTTHLALVGELSARPGPASLTVHDVGPDGLEEWVVTKLKSFADTEATPSDELVAREVAVRAPEMALARLQVARLGGDAVAVLAYYFGADQLVFTLGTRLPFRHHGIAQQLLSRWVAAGRAEGCRSLMINADHLGAPEALYKRMGFVDEIYWYQRYEF
jgi:GNAT superfamily N-acetyltransferase